MTSRRIRVITVCATVAALCLAVLPAAASAAGTAFVGYKKAEDGLPFATWCFSFADAQNDYWYKSGYGWYCKGAQTYRFDPGTPDKAEDDEYYMRSGNFMYDADQQAQKATFFPAADATGKWKKYK